MSVLYVFDGNLNGESRWLAFLVAVVVAAAAYATLCVARRQWVCLRYAASAVLAAVWMWQLAHWVREGCRGPEGWYPECGQSMKDGIYVGWLVAAAVVWFALRTAKIIVARGERMIGVLVGYLIGGIGLYYADFMLFFDAWHSSGTAMARRLALLVLFATWAIAALTLARQKAWWQLVLPPAKPKKAPVLV